MKNINKFTSQIRLPQTGAVYGIVVLIIFFSLFTHNFFTVPNFTNVIRQAAVLSIITICSFLALLTHQTDLSVGAIAGLAGVLATKFMEQGMSLILSCFLSAGVCIIMGLISGVLIGYTKIAPFIITLGMMGIAESIGMVISKGTVQIKSEAFIWLNNGNLWFIPISALITISLYLIFNFILNSRPYGTHLYALGGREESAWASGINVKLLKVSIFTINGLLASIAGFILAARLMSANPSQGIGLELDGITAAVLGGTALSGGKGTIWGALLGAIALSILRNGLNMIGLSSALQMMVIGFILILIIAIDVLRREKD